MRYVYRLEERSNTPVELDIETEGEGYRIVLPGGQTYVVQAQRKSSTIIQIALCSVDGRPMRWLRVPVVELDGRTAVSWNGRVYSFWRQDGQELDKAFAEEDAQEVGRIKAPMVGVVSEVLVTEGQRVGAEQPLLVLEAMKVVMRMNAPFTGTVQRLHVQQGQLVSHGELLVELSQE